MTQPHNTLVDVVHLVVVVFLRRTWISRLHTLPHTPRSRRPCHPSRFFLFREQETAQPWPVHAATRLFPKHEIRSCEGRATAYLSPTPMFVLPPPPPQPHAKRNVSYVQRRIYDITNVLEGIGLIHKTSKNHIQWKGRGDGAGEENNNQEEDEIQVRGGGEHGGRTVRARQSTSRSGGCVSCHVLTSAFSLGFCTV